MQSYEDMKMAYMSDEELEAYYCEYPHLRPVTAKSDPEDAARIERSIRFLNGYINAVLESPAAVSGEQEKERE